MKFVLVVYICLAGVCDSVYEQKLYDTGQLKVESLPPQEDNSVMIEKLKQNTDLMKMKKAELLEMANKLNLDVNSKNTKAEIVTAIEKQSR